LRILLDYRPALRERTGVGEYVHELAAALTRHLAPDDALTLFSSSWKDRLPADRVPGARIVDARIPVQVLNMAWHRLGWPPVEQFAGPIDIAHSLHPLLMPARRATQLVTVHDLDFLDHPERTRAEIRRDYRTLAPDHARRAAAVVTISRFTAAEVERRLGIPRDRIVICAPGAPAWSPRPGPAPGGPILFMGTLEPRKNVGVLLEAYATLLAMMPGAPPLWLAGGATAAAAPWLRAIAEPPLAGHVEHLGYIAADRRYTSTVRRCSSSIAPEGFGMPVLEAMTAGVPVIVSNRALPEPATPRRSSSLMTRRIRRRDAPLSDRPCCRAGGDSARFLPSSSYPGTPARRRSPLTPVCARMTLPARSRSVSMRVSLAHRVGRYLGELLRRWAVRPDAPARRFALDPEALPFVRTVPEAANVREVVAGSDAARGGADALRAVRADPPTSSSPAPAWPLALGVPLAVTIHDVSFAASPTGSVRVKGRAGGC
jgi:glycosyltransferase involved in cell wall biosynthesis